MQKLESATDHELLARCTAEDRALVTLDLDFANPLVFSPARHAGVAVLRLPRKPTLKDLDQAISTVVGVMSRQSLNRQLWIVEIGRVRVYSP